ncbi:MAG: creatininase family protein [Anaerolineae bacterium]|nr:creatininase family protein [Anaerolineae bacterium]
MRLEDMNWMDVERYLERDTRIILITGATEQHAYLSLLTDIIVPSRLALAVAERENVLIAPPLNFGNSRYFAEFPGTITLTQHTFDLVVLEIVESLLHQGFRRFLILNGHGGNQVPVRLQDFMQEDEIRVVWYNWWRSDAVKAFEAKHNLLLNHANWGENFPFNRVAESPSEIKETVSLDDPDDKMSARELLGDGSFGGPYQVDDALMEELFGMVVDEATDLIREMADRE